MIATFTVSKNATSVSDRKAKFQILVRKLLLQSGNQDPNEFRFWENVFDGLTAAEQEDVLVNLKEELEAVQA